MLATTLTIEQFKAFTEQAKVDLGHFRPELLIICLVAGILLANVFLKREDSRLLAWPSLLGTLGALWLVFARYGGEPGILFNQSLRGDRFADFFSIVFLVGTAVSIVLAALSKELE